ncbi:MAG: DNA topoisomerase [Oscillospiraceae bacterium]|nr:DNA topoisomerase [Oscillospiraceae bacterium]
MKEKLLLIAEKPSLMRDLKATYIAHTDEIPYDIDFVALSGHICGYAAPKEYEGWDLKWKNLPVPMIPRKWKINVMNDKKKMFSEIEGKIKTGNYDGFICATDADREGNLIYYLLEAKMELKKKTYRLWVHDLTDKVILESFKNMVDLHIDDFQKNLTYASILRSRFDWLVGMNATVSASTHSNMLMKIGRVKTPTLKIVYDNSMAIDNFKPTTTFQIESIYTEGFSGILFNDDGDISYKTEEDAKDFLKSFTDTAVVESIETKKAKTMAPPLYKLSDLQIAANKAYGYTAEKTLSLVQSLYETHKVISYPRCDCRHISSALAKDFINLLAALEPVDELKPFVSQISKADMDAVAKNKKYVNDVEVNKNSHTALMPTGKKPDMNKLSLDEANVMIMIFKRFLSIFLPPLIENKTVLITKNNDFRFKTNGKIVLDKGFTILLNKAIEDTELPSLKKGQVVHVDNFKIKEKTTSPPARLTEGQLIAEMENISKYIEDDELKEVMKSSKGIGTPATRGAIISNLISDDYIEKKKSKKVETLYISEKGKTYIENLMNFDIVSPDLTATWEQKLKDVEQGILSSTEFSNQMLKYVTKAVTSLRSLKRSNTPYKSSSNVTKKRRESLGKCPRCGCDIVEGKKAFGCMGYKNDTPCKFVILKENEILSSQNKKLTSVMIKSLLKTRLCSVKGFTSAETGNKYDVDLKLVDTGTIVRLDI